MVTGERGDIYGAEVEESGEGLCSCPDFAETRACKHLGAVAIVAEGMEPTQARLLNGRFARLRDALAFEDAGALTQLILRLAKTVPGVLEALEGEEGAADELGKKVTPASFLLDETDGCRQFGR